MSGTVGASLAQRLVGEKGKGNRERNVPTASLSVVSSLCAGRPRATQTPLLGGDPQV